MSGFAICNLRFAIEGNTRATRSELHLQSQTASVEPAERDNCKLQIQNYRPVTRTFGLLRERRRRFSLGFS
jgi:hypothetical protein